MDYKIIIKRHSQSKSMRLKIDPIKKVPVLVVPKRCCKKTIDEFIRRSEDWIASQLQQYTPNDDSIPISISFKGDSYHVDFFPCEKKSYVTLDSEQKKIIIHGSLLTQKLSLVKFFKKSAMKEAVEYLGRFQKVLNVKVKNIGIKDYKSRWGCCYKRGDIFLSWRLIMAPPHVFEYVCAHEVVHLIHQNHSAAFWQTVTEIFPNFNVSYHWLKKNGTSLFQVI